MNETLVLKVALFKVTEPLRRGSLGLGDVTLEEIRGPQASLSDFLFGTSL